MDYFAKVEVLAKRVLIETDSYFDRHIRNALEDYEGAFILGVSRNTTDLLILDKDSNGFNLEDKEAEMEYIHQVFFEIEVPMYLHGKDDKVTEINREQAFELYMAFCAELFSNPQTANMVEP